jgi:hypothetical protein
MHVLITDGLIIRVWRVQGGNDHEIFEKVKEKYGDPDHSPGHAVKSPADTIRICKELFLDT